MDQQYIRDRLYGSVLSVARAAGRNLSQGNEIDISNMAEQAARAMIDLSSDESQLEALIAEGESAFAQLAEEMVSAANSIPGYPHDRLGEQTLIAAQKAKGPWPPFW